MISGKRKVGGVMMKDIVLYDGNCGFCRLSKNMAKKLDWLRNLEWIELERYQGVLFSQEELESEIHLVTSSGKVLRGFSAIRRILWQLPLTTILSLLLYLPFAKWFGDRVYAFVAKYRGKIMELLNAIGVATPAV